MYNDTKITVSVDRKLSEKAMLRFGQLGINRASMLRALFAQIVAEQKLPDGMQIPESENNDYPIKDRAQFSIPMDAALKEMCDKTFQHIGLTYSSAASALLAYITKENPCVGIVELIDRLNESCLQIIPVDGKLLRRYQQTIAETGYTMPSAIEHIMWSAIMAHNKVEQEKSEKAIVTNKPEESMPAVSGKQGASQAFTIPLSITVSVDSGITPHRTT